MEADAKQHGFSVLANRGLDFSFASCAIDGMRDEQFSCYLDLADRMSSSPSCTGLANHALLLVTHAVNGTGGEGEIQSPEIGRAHV